MAWFNVALGLIQHHQFGTFFACWVVARTSLCCALTSYLRSKKDSIIGTFFCDHPKNLAKIPTTQHLSLVQVADHTSITLLWSKCLSLRIAFVAPLHLASERAGWFRPYPVTFLSRGNHKLVIFKKTEKSLTNMLL